MANKKNQHFVAQSFFRNFSNNRSCINLLIKRNGKVVHDASIKGQCSKPYFYGNSKGEDAISALESHVSIINDLSKVNTDKDFQIIVEKPHFSRIYMGILFQRYRTELSAFKSKQSSDQLELELFKEYLKHAPNIPDDVRQNIDLLTPNTFKINRPYRHYIGATLSCLPNLTYYLIDLGIHILKNKTSIPFIFGDSPVIFYNQYYRNVKQRGVLGLATPGLMIFYPMSPDTMLLLLDESKYRCPWKRDGVYEITGKFDIKHINKLQIHNAFKTIYFPDSMPDKTVLRYWKQERSNLKPPNSGFAKRQLVVDGVLENDVMHSMEPQLPYVLKLSFIESDVLSDFQYTPHRRNQAIHELVKELENGGSEDALKNFEDKILY